MGKVNIASGNDVVAFQVGHVNINRPGKAAKPTNPQTTGSATVTNIRRGNAHVGVQAKEVRTTTCR